MSYADELAKLQRLRDTGALDAEEFEHAKRQLLDGPPPAASVATDPGPANFYVTPAPAAASGRSWRTWAMILHLSQFAGYALPLAGFIVPVVIWLSMRDEMPELDAHGREVANWMITELIFGGLFAVLTIVLIGIPLLLVLGVMGIVFPMIGAIRASEGTFWRYPMTIRFL